MAKAKVRAWVTMDQERDEDRYLHRLFIGTEEPVLIAGFWQSWDSAYRDCDLVTFNWRLPKLFAKGLTLRRGECVEVELPRLRRRAK